MPDDDLRKQLLSATGGRCAYCGTTLELDGSWHIEHMVPRLHGGGQGENLVPACPSCNLRKGGQGIEEYREWIRSKLLKILSRDFMPFFEFAVRFYTENARLEAFGQIEKLKGMIERTPIAFLLDEMRLEERNGLAEDRRSIP